MTPLAVLRRALPILAPLAVILTTYLYLYPVFLGCAFPLPPLPGHDHAPVRPELPNSISSAAFHATIQQHLNASNNDRAPFRLLTLADPQLEGDSSIPNYGFDPFWHLTWALKHLTFQTRQSSLRHRVKQILHDIIDFLLDDIPNAIEGIRKRIDLFGNDFYLAHIYRTLHWWTKPTHVTVLGDLIGSQWVSDEEFERRSWRYWNRSFRGAERVPDEIAQEPAQEYELAGFLGIEDERAAAWRRRIINIAGNHDVGYAGDLTKERIERFERAFGKAAYELRFELPITNATTNATIYNAETNSESDRLVPELRLVIINNMNLDTPAHDQELQDATYGFLNSAINTASAVDFKGHFTLVLTHIPLYKPEGICVDAPFFDFFEENGGVKEQNQLSAEASNGFLEGIYGLSSNPHAAGNGMGRKGLILNGHDHEGCDTYHYINQTEKPEPKPVEKKKKQKEKKELKGDESEGEREDAKEEGEGAEKRGEHEGENNEGKNNEEGANEEGEEDEDEDDEEDNPVWEGWERVVPPPWRVARWQDAQGGQIAGLPGVPGVREITVRSMMGDFGGNAALLSAWFDEETWEWRYEIVMCSLGSQNIWWLTHIIDLTLIVALLSYAGLNIALAAGLDADRWPPELLRLLKHMEKKGYEAFEQAREKIAAAIAAAVTAYKSRKEQAQTQAQAQAQKKKDEKQAGPQMPTDRKQPQEQKTNGIARDAAAPQVKVTANGVNGNHVVDDSGR